MFAATIRHKRQVADNAFEVRLSPSGAFDFKAGQHIEVYLENMAHTDPRGSMRIFSIVSTPHKRNDEIAIAFRGGSGFKRSLLDLPIGSKVAISAPLGHFTLPAKPSSNLICIAGGIGITPFLSMLRFVTEQNLTHTILLLYANRDHKSAAYLHELEELEKKNERLTVKKIIGRIGSDDLISAMQAMDTVLWYLAGPPAMTHDVQHILTVLGVNPGSIISESFFCYFLLV